MLLEKGHPADWSLISFLWKKTLKTALFAWNALGNGALLRGSSQTVFLSSGFGGLRFGGLHCGSLGHEVLQRLALPAEGGGVACGAP